MKSTTDRTNAVHAIADWIRQESQAGRIVPDSGILHQLADWNLCSFPSTVREDFLGLLKEAMNENEDLHELGTGNGARYYYSSTFMTESYATILCQKQGDPLHVIAANVRLNSSVYPRPVPLDIFTEPPFDFTRQEIRDCLDRMGAETEFCDIALTTTSSSRVFLYSAIHLEPGHASMLAEWLDVGQQDNP